MLQYVTLCVENLSKEKAMKTQITKKDVLTAEEVAEYLRIHPYTVRRLARDGKLPGFKVGGQWRFNNEEIKKLKGK